MKFISLEQLLALHVIAIEKFGGSPGIRDLGRLEAAIAAQSQEVFGREIYPTVVDKAAAICRNIIADHAFVDGNKRTGMLAALTILELNGRTVSAKPGEIEDFAVRIAVDQLDIPTIAGWLAAHTSN
jgi:death on curing protein